MRRRVVLEMRPEAAIAVSGLTRWVRDVRMRRLHALGPNRRCQRRGRPGLDAEGIENNPERYKSWEFDGCSGLPDQIMGFFTGCSWEEITYKCCLPHDLCYGYGEEGNDIERERVDLKFYSNLVTKAGMKKWQASAFLAAVRAGGSEVFGFSFSWGFAHKD